MGTPSFAVPTLDALASAPDRDVVAVFSRPDSKSGRGNRLFPSKVKARAQELGIPVYVHHTPIPVDCGSILEYNNLRRSFGRCQDQITAIGRELFSGMFAELPNVKMIHSMLGGGYFTFKEMLMPWDSGGGRFDTNTEAIKKYLRENIYFELSHAQPWGKEPLELAVKILGADHIIYGSSYPVKQVWMTGGPAFVEALDVTGEEKEQMLGGNARRIYGA